MVKLTTELIGTFFLTFTIGMTAIGSPDGHYAAVPVAMVLMAMVYAGGHLSGAHFNPAVTLAIWLRGRCSASDVPGYMFVQFVAAAMAAVAVRYFKGEAAAYWIQPGLVRIFLAELIFTFALAYVMLNVATAKRTTGKSYFGLAIGGTLLAGAESVGDVSGAVFNPAVALGVAIIGLSPLHGIWVFMTASFTGAALAAFVFTTQNPDDR